MLALEYLDDSATGSNLYFYGYYVRQWSKLAMKDLQLTLIDTEPGRI